MCGGGKKRGEGGMRCWISISWKERAKHLLWMLLATQATHSLVCCLFFFHPPCSPVFQEVWSPEPVWRPGAAELEKDCHECSSTHCLSHARTPPRASPCARTLAPHSRTVPCVVSHSVKFHGATESPRGPLGLQSQPPSHGPAQDGTVCMFLVTQ